jgi:hypothetical protein
MPSARAAAGAAITALALGAAGAAQAGSAGSAGSGYCDAPAERSAAEQSRLLRASAVLARVLDESGARAAIVSRSGLDLRWFDQRYSHAGLALRAGGDSGPWVVRQLYYACDERQPRLYDQGLPAFVLGTDDAALGFVSLLLLPEHAAPPVLAAALDNRRALSLLGASYSANAYPFDTRHQNCNQWLAELLALAWRGGEIADTRAARREAQAWLRERGFEGTAFAVPWPPLLALTAFSPYLHLDDHPEADRRAGLLQVTMPQSIEAFVGRTVGGAERIELCHTAEHVVVRRGGPPLPDTCTAGPGDAVTSLR